MAMAEVMAAIGADEENPPKEDSRSLFLLDLWIDDLRQLEHPE